MSIEHDMHIPQPEFPFEAARSTKSLEPMLLQDFHLSFKFSQGNPSVQGAIINHLHAIYRQSLSAEQLAALPALMDSMDSRIPHLALPKGHRPQEPTVVVKDFNTRWKQFKQLSATRTDLDSATVFADSMHRLSTQFIHMDLEYVQGGSLFGARASGDPYASLYRSYVLGAKPTGSQSFDLMFDWMRQQLVDQNPHAPEDDLDFLARSWEKRHPGELFYPGDFIQEKQHMATLRMLGYTGITIPPR